MTIHPSVTAVIWLLLVAGGIVIQIALRDEATRDMTAVQVIPVEFLPPHISRDTMLVTARRARERATTHLLIKALGILIGLWSLVIPPAILAERLLFSEVASVYFLFVVLALDYEGIRDLIVRRQQLGLSIPFLSAFHERLHASSRRNR